MENKTKKCSSKKHKEIDAVFYCPECHIYICHKCENYHSDLFESHHCYNLNTNLPEIFTGICKEEDHLDKLKYFCKNHNKLCCGACISKIIGKGNGQHTNCDVCFIEEIKEIKKNKLNESIKYLEDLSINFEKSIEKLKEIFIKFNEKQEILKKNVQKIFTKIRNELDKREDELLLEIENIYKNIYFDEKIIKEGEKLPNNIKISLEKVKKINDEWNDNNNLSSLINDCINVENNIKTIKEIEENVKKCSSINEEIKFEPEEDNLCKYFHKISNFGNVYIKGESKVKMQKRQRNENLNNHVLLISNKKIPLLNNLLKFINEISEISIVEPQSFIPEIKYEKIKNYKIIIYDLNDSGYQKTNNANDIKNYLINGGNLIVTHDHWTHVPKKSDCIQLLGAELQTQSYKVVNKIKILNNTHPVLNSFFDLRFGEKDLIDVSLTHKTDTVYKNQKEYFNDLIIELEDGKNGEYLLIKEIGKGKLIFWNAGHSYDLTDFEKKLFMNLIYWIC